jgi:two-component system, LytTR family, response regulator
MKAILIDDERMATELLALKLQKLNMGIEIVAQFNQPEAALDTLRHSPFDLLFLDIEMPRLNGFDLLTEVGTSLPFDVIFTTAYDQYAIRAFQYSAASYLLKPVQEDELRATILRWQQRSLRHMQQAQLTLLREQYAQPAAPRTRLALPTHDGHEIIEITDIVRCMADAAYTHFYLASGRTLLICRTLKEVETALEPSGFVRTHHSHLINPTYLSKIVRQEGGYLLMTDGAQVPVTKPKRDWLLERIGSVGRA